MTAKTWQYRLFHEIASWSMLPVEVKDAPGFVDDIVTQGLRFQDLYRVMILHIGHWQGKVESGADLAGMSG